MNAKEIIEWVKSQNIEPSSDEAICNFVSELKKKSSRQHKIMG